MAKRWPRSAPIHNTSLGLTDGHPPIVAQQIRTTVCGQAHFANTGPFGATCGDCLFLGYVKRNRNAQGEIVHTEKRAGCGKFNELTAKHGPVLPPGTPSCKYFAPKLGH